MKKSQSELLVVFIIFAISFLISVLFGLNQALIDSGVPALAELPIPLLVLSLLLVWYFNERHQKLKKETDKLTEETASLRLDVEEHQIAEEQARLVSATKEVILQNELDRSNRLDQIRVMSNFLAATSTLKELQGVAANCLKDFLSDYTAGIYFLNEKQSQWHLARSWGGYQESIHEGMSAEDFWMMTSGQDYYESINEQSLKFDESVQADSTEVTCYPIFCQEERFGVLHIRSDGQLDQLLNDEDQKLLMDFCKTLGLHFYNAKLRSELSMASNRDELTGLLNRRGLGNTLKREIKASALQGYEVSVAMIDIDHFKQYNDTYGHQDGDHALKFVADTLTANIRSRDVLARYGGEEFILILPQTSKAEAFKKLSHLIKRVEKQSLQSPWCKRAITLSVGLATAPKDQMNEEKLTRLADTALYAAKEKGRNCVVPFLLPKKHNVIRAE